MRVVIRKDGSDGVWHEDCAEVALDGHNEKRVTLPRLDRVSSIISIALGRLECDECGLNLYDSDDEDDFEPEPDSKLRRCPGCGRAEQTSAGGILTNLAPYSGLCIECLGKRV